MSIEDNEIQQLYTTIDRVTADVNPLLSAGGVDGKCPTHIQDCAKSTRV